MPYIGKTPSQATRARYYLTASGGETSISGSMTVGGTLTFTDGNFVDVSVNGVALVAGTDYNTNTANTIAGLSALTANDQVEIIVYDTFSVFSGDVDSDFSVGGNLSVTGTSTLTGAVTASGGATLSSSSSGEFNALTISQADNTSGNESRIRFKRTTDAGSDREVAAIVADRLGGNDTDLVFETNTDGSDGSVEKMRLSHLGILSIDQIFGLGDTDTGLALGANGSDILQLYTGNSERARIDDNGNLLVGVTSAALSANTGVQAAGPIESNHSLRAESNSIAVNIGNDGGTAVVGAATNHGLNLFSNNTTRLQLTNDGVLGNFNGRNSAGIISSKTSITVDDDSSVTIVDASASQIAGRGMLLIYETSGGSGGTFTAGFNSATLLNTTNYFGTGADFVVGDTDNNFCVIVSGHEITFKNRIGSSRAFHIQFIGAGIT